MAFFNKDDKTLCSGSLPPYLQMRTRLKRFANAIH